MPLNRFKVSNEVNYMVIVRGDKVFPLYSGFRGCFCLLAVLRSRVRCGVPLSAAQVEHGMCEKRYGIGNSTMTSIIRFDDITDQRSITIWPRRSQKILACKTTT